MVTLQPSSSFPPNLLHRQFLRTPMLGKTRVRTALQKNKKKLRERNKIPRTEALKKHKQAIKDKSKQVPFTIAYNLASPNIQDILRKKKRILYSTQRLKEKSTKKYLLLLSVAQLTFVTYSFVRNSQTPAIHPRWHISL